VHSKTCVLAPPMRNRIQLTFSATCNWAVSRVFAATQAHRPSRRCTHALATCQRRLASTGSENPHEIIACKANRIRGRTSPASWFAKESFFESSIWIFDTESVVSAPPVSKLRAASRHISADTSYAVRRFACRMIPCAELGQIREAGIRQTTAIRPDCHNCSLN
jgi:hypothetical protein